MQLSMAHEAVSELADLLPQQVRSRVAKVGHLMMMTPLALPLLFLGVKVFAVAGDGHLLQLGERGRGLPLCVVLEPEVAAVIPLQVSPPRGAHCAHIGPGGTGAASWTSPESHEKQN